jgi:hypothetical protein
MAINIDIYSNSNISTRTVTVDFMADLLSDSMTAASSEIVFYFKFTTSARDTSNIVYPPKVVKGLSDLALARVKQSANDSANAYTSIAEMIQDYTYDFIYGHTADQFSSGVSAKPPMKFT